jgi:hypothetical protein
MLYPSSKAHGAAMERPAPGSSLASRVLKEGYLLKKNHESRKITLVGAAAVFVVLLAVGAGKRSAAAVALLRAGRDAFWLCTANARNVWHGTIAPSAVPPPRSSPLRSRLPPMAAHAAGAQVQNALVRAEQGHARVHRDV